MTNFIFHVRLAAPYSFQAHPLELRYCFISHKLISKRFLRSQVFPPDSVCSH
jgi:hypothetical protein